MKTPKYTQRPNDPSSAIAADNATPIATEPSKLPEPSDSQAGRLFAAAPLLDCNFQDLESFIYSNWKCSNPIQISRDEFFSNPFLRGWLSFYDSFKVKHPEASLHEVGEAYCVESGIPTEDGTHKFMKTPKYTQRPNDPSSPTPPTETPRLEPRADGGVGCSAWLGRVLGHSEDVIKNSLITIARKLQSGEEKDMGGILQNNILTFLRLNNPEMLESLRRLPASSLCRQP